MKWFIRAENLWFSYDGRVSVIRGANLEIPPGEIVVIMGHTGCGKTTLLLLLAGLLKPSSGIIYYNGEPLEKLLPSIRRYIGFLFQNPDDQLFNSTVYDEIAYSLRTLGLSENDIHMKVTSISKLLGLESLLNKPPYSLSIGEKRRVTLASILVYNPQILILDEPIANLDYEGIMLVNKIIRDFKSKNNTVVISTHDIDFALEIADRVFLMSKGVVEGPFKPIDLLSRDLIERYKLKPPLVLKLAEKLGISLDRVLEVIRNS